MKLMTPVLIYCFLFTLLFTSEATSQISVTGNVHTSKQPVHNALVTFIDNSDTSKKYSTLTDTAGNFQLSIITAVFTSPSAVPQSIELAQNYPNPFSSSTAISYQLNTQADVSITIYDILGREVKRFTVGAQPLGVHSVMWDGKNSSSGKVATGIYFYRLRTEKETLIKKMIYLGNKEGVNIPIPRATLPKIVSHQNDKLALTQTTSNKYTLKISNTEQTEPPIELTIDENIIITQDTVINIRVLDATPGVWHYLGLGSETVDAIAVHPKDSNIIYVGTGSDFSSGAFAKLFKTTNGGRSWDTLMIAPPPFSFYDIVIDPLHPETLYATPFPVLKSTNGGKTWFEIMNGIYIDWETRAAPIIIDPSNTNTLYCGTTGFFGGSFYKATNGGENWIEITSDDRLKNGVISIAIDPNNSNIIYTGTSWSGHLLKTTDAGVTWISSGLGETNQLIHDILIHPFNSQIIWAAIQEMGVWKTEDGGNTWIQYNEGLIDSLKSAMKIIIRKKSSDVFLVNASQTIINSGIYKRSSDNEPWIKIGLNGIKEYYYSDIKLSNNENTLYFGSKGLYYLKLK